MMLRQPCGIDNQEIRFGTPKRQASVDERWLECVESAILCPAEKHLSFEHESWKKVETS